MNIDSLLESFFEFQIVDLRRTKRTAYNKVWLMRKFLSHSAKPVDMVSDEEIREYLKNLRSSAATYKNTLAALKVFFRDFLGMPKVVASFRFPQLPFKPKEIVTTAQLQRFYESLDLLRDRALFLLYATSGLRRTEVTSLNFQNIDFYSRMITPNNHEGRTKQSWVSFYNEEAEKVLNEYLEKKKASRSRRLFPM